MEVVLKQDWQGRNKGTHLDMDKQTALKLIENGIAESVQEKAEFPQGMEKAEQDKMMKSSPVIKG